MSGPIYSINELSEMLGISKQTVYHWVHRGEIPYLKVGKHLRFDYEEVLEHFRASTPSRTPSPASRLRKHGSLAIEEKKRGNLSHKGGRHGDY